MLDKGWEKMLVVRKKQNIDIYQVDVNFEKLIKINEQIKKDCSYIYEQRVIMPTKFSYNKYFVILSSVEKFEHDDYLGTMKVYENLCRITKYPLVCEHIDLFLKTNDQENIIKIFESMLENVKLNDSEKSIIDTPKKNILYYALSLRNCFKFKKIKTLKSDLDQFDYISEDKIKTLGIK